MATTVTLKPNAIDLSGSTSGTTTLQATAVAGTTTITLPAATDTLVGKATTDTLTNKTLTSPTLTTPVLGTPSSGTLTNCTGLPNAGLVNSSVTIGGTAIALGASSSTITNDLSISGLTVGKGGGAVSTNTAVGASALNATNTGGKCTAFGYQALLLTTGKENTAVGSDAGAAMTSGEGLAAFGWSAAKLNTGDNNTAIGHNSLGSNTTASNNTACGNAALNANTTGASNVAIGRQALVANTTASNNTAVGYQAGYTNVTGTNNTYTGWSAGKLATGNSNTAFGSYSAFSLTSGSGNTFYGTSSGGDITTGAKNTIIGSYGGNQGGLDIRTASNYIVLSDGDGNPKLITDGSGYFFRSASGAFTSGTNCWQLRADTGCIQLSNSGTGATTVANFYNGNGAVGSISTSGSLTSYNVSSDYRLKNTIAPMTGALAKVALLKPCTYKWNADGSDGEGFIAHELAEVVPHAVTGEKDAVDKEGNPNHQGIDVSFLVATLTAAIQELKAEFDAYKATHP